MLDDRPDIEQAGDCLTGELNADKGAVCFCGSVRHGRRGQAEDAKVMALGIADHEVTKEELDKGAALPAPHFNTPAVAYALAANIKKGDMVEVALSNDEKSLLATARRLTEDQASLCCKRASAACRRAAGREWTYTAAFERQARRQILIDRAACRFRSTKRSSPGAARARLRLEGVDVLALLQRQRRYRRGLPSGSV